MFFNKFDHIMNCSPNLVLQYLELCSILTNFYGIFQMNDNLLFFSSIVHTILLFELFRKKNYKNYIHYLYFLIFYINLQLSHFPLIQFLFNLYYIFNFDYYNFIHFFFLFKIGFYLLINFHHLFLTIFYFLLNLINFIFIFLNKLFILKYLNISSLLLIGNHILNTIIIYIENKKIYNLYNITIFHSNYFYNVMNLNFYLCLLYQFIYH